MKDCLYSETAWRQCRDVVSLTTMTEVGFVSEGAGMRTLWSQMCEAVEAGRDES